MKTRYRLIRRGTRGGTFYCVDSLTGKRASLSTGIRVVVASAEVVAAFPAADSPVEVAVLAAAAQEEDGNNATSKIHKTTASR